MTPRAVYIHIPFCTNKCFYCDFTAYVVEGQPVDKYLDALFREMALTVAEVPPREIEAIFIGGGTPTVLTPQQMELLCEKIRLYFPKWSEEIEFTIEANPGTTSPELLRVMHEGGINRISFGAQTFRPQLLKRIGRIHEVEDIKRSVFQAREAGFHNISLDLMFGLPEQTVQDMKETLQHAGSLKPDHFSCYSLKIEEGTLFHQLYERKQLPLPTEDDELTMYQLIRSELQSHGYEQYEVSNFAKPGYESKHNSTYWLNEEYYGLGAGAHGYMNGIRHANVKGIKEYIRRVNGGHRPVVESYQVSDQEDRENFMMLGLRLMQGVNKDRFFSLYQQTVDEVFGGQVQQLKKLGLIIEENDNIRLTEKGLLFGNEVFASFLDG
ncbi:radical SAM family heme chaperone HemW [Hazenella coriacea]|uniref:Heme chaperone HemW n=1 Tax=Hazenella coriacea TaxID=1179467 RepID=A0A4R3L6R8_9BACL|nr:radical SAM family heme chaperone HemW [Hazenella coriacea]TCS94778.1 oxygen-independent coproporphyrinogen-3 oxidase [Hazenella coriacea]